MPRTFAVSIPLPLLALLVLLPGWTLAAPPEGVSGKTVVDEVSQGLQKYQREHDAARRFRWLEKLAPTRDPRVGVAMGEYLSGGRDPFPYQVSVGWLLKKHFMPPAPDEDDVVAQTQAARRWWQENESDLRHQAKRLPR